MHFIYFCTFKMNCEVMKMYIQFNANPKKRKVGDCVIRAISTVTHKSWEQVYSELVSKGFAMYDMPTSNEVWKSYLNDLGFDRYIIPNTCPDCYTVKDFCYDYPIGEYILGTGSHAIAVIDGSYYDTWDSGEETPIYYFRRRD